MLTSPLRYPHLRGASLSLLTDLYELTMAYGFWRTGLAGHEAVFHVTFRTRPFQGGYAIAAGLADVVADKPSDLPRFDPARRPRIPRRLVIRPATPQGRTLMAPQCGGPTTYRTRQLQIARRGLHRAAGCICRVSEEQVRAVVGAISSLFGPTP